MQQQRLCRVARDGVVRLGVEHDAPRSRLCQRLGEGCGKGAGRVQEGPKRVPERACAGGASSAGGVALEVSRRVSRGCLGGVWRRCLGGVQDVSRKCLERSLVCGGVEVDSADSVGVAEDRDPIKYSSFIVSEA